MGAGGEFLQEHAEEAELGLLLFAPLCPGVFALDSGLLFEPQNMQKGKRSVNHGWNWMGTAGSRRIFRFQSVFICVHLWLTGRVSFPFCGTWSAEFLTQRTRRPQSIKVTVAPFVTFA